MGIVAESPAQELVANLTLRAAAPSLTWWPLGFSIRPGRSREFSASSASDRPEGESLTWSRSGSAAPCRWTRPTRTSSRS